jgi:hypothetical protein
VHKHLFTPKRNANDQPKRQLNPSLA